MWLTQVVGCLLITCSSGTSMSTENPESYQFSYTVNSEETGDYKTHQEVSDGKGVRGMYTVGEPNGDLRVVTYTADSARGFQATVQVHPAGSPAALKSLQTSDDSKHSFSGSPSGNNHAETKLKAGEDFQVETSLDSWNETGVKDQDQVTQRLPEEIQDDSTLAIMQINTTETDLDNTERLTVEDSKDIMKVLKEFPPIVDKQTPVKDYTFETQEGEGPKNIPIKIEEQFSPSDTESEDLSFDVSTYKSILLNDDGITTQSYHNQQTTNEQNKQVYSPTEEKDNNESKSKLSSVIPEISIPILHNKLQEYIKSNNSKNIQLSNDQQDRSKLSEADKSITQQYTTIDKWTSTISNTLNDLTGLSNALQTNKPSVQKHLEKEQPNIVETDDVEKLNNRTDLKFSNFSNSEKKPDSVHRDSVMLAALVSQNPTVMKFLCLPEMSANPHLNTAPTVPSNVPMVSTQTNQQQNFQQHRLVLTTGIPFYPFQIINYNPLPHPESSTFTKTKITSQVPVISFGTQSTVNTISNTNGPTVPSPHSHSDAPTVEPLRQHQPLSQGQPWASHYPHHLIPYPWVHPNPHRSTQTKRFPIFVLPMSHNFNYAPTFDPAMFDSHVH